MIAKSMKPFLAGSSVIRAMFEEGKKMAKVYGPENVYDFSVGNPGLNPPQEVFDAIQKENKAAVASSEKESLDKISKLFQK